MASAMEFVDNYNTWILDKFRPYMGKNFLEIGTGQGNFKKMLSGFSQKYVSIDIDEKVISRAKERDPSGIYEVVDVSSPGFVAALAHHKIDTIIFINVIEHIPDHKSALNNAVNLLEKGGHVLLFTPAFMYLYNDLDRLAGHIRRYRKRDINNLLKQNVNCEVVFNEYFNPIGAFGWWVNRFRTHTNIDSKNVNKQVLFFDRYILPFSRALNPVFKTFFGQSVYCVIKKI